MGRNKSRLSQRQLRDCGIRVEFLEGVSRRDPGQSEVLEALADLYVLLGRAKEAVAIDERLKGLRPDDPEIRYNLACSLTLNRDFEAAAAELSFALELGFSDVQTLQSDPDLADLRAHPAFRSVRARLRSLNAGKGPDRAGGV